MELLATGLAKTTSMATVGWLFLPEFAGAVITAGLFGYLFRTRWVPVLALSGLAVVVGSAALLAGLTTSASPLVAVGTAMIGLGVGSAVSPPPAPWDARPCSGWGSGACRRLTSSGGRSTTRRRGTPPPCWIAGGPPPTTARAAAAARRRPPARGRPVPRRCASPLAPPRQPTGPAPTRRTTSEAQPASSATTLPGDWATWIRWTADRRTPTGDERQSPPPRTRLGTATNMVSICSSVTPWSRR